MDQALTNTEGRFSFTGLPWGLYWVTARRENALEDTAVFRHAEISPAQPAATLELVMLSSEVLEPEKVLHKPVLFRIVDNLGRPRDKVGLEIIWSNGPLLDNVKGETGRDGTLAVELLPGRNFVTLRHKGCPKQDYRADVAPGDGIDGFKLVFECAKQ
jgi:hypothetical protein